MLEGRFDLDDPRTLIAAYDGGRLDELYRQLAAESPLWRLPDLPDVYLACTRELVDEAIARPEDFSSNLTRVLYREDDGAPAMWDMAPLGDVSQALATADAPRHTTHRRLLLPLLARRAMTERETAVRAIARELVEALPSASPDITTGLADPLTMRVICQVVGIPETEAPHLVQAVIGMDRLICGLATRVEMEAGAAAALDLMLRLLPYLQGDPPAESILGQLQAGMAEGELSDTECLSILLQIVTAGTETTATLIGHAVRQLARDVTEQRRLRADTSAIPDFLDGVLRYDGPFHFHYRTTTQATTLGGQHLPAHASVLLMWASADRTASRLGPEPASHVAFGRGIHFCIGAHLARLEGRIAVEELLTRVPSFEPDPTRPTTSRRSLMMTRPTSTPLRWT